MNESVIDFPKPSLCEDIWDKVTTLDGMSDDWRLRPEVEALLLSISSKLMEHLNLTPDTIHVTGSITSNSYTKNADVDLHFVAANHPEIDADKANKDLRAYFEEIKSIDPSCASVGTHPIEVYLQTNEFQDFMSVGCYDLVQRKWIVGPELQNPEFNPYSEYYAEIKQRAGKVASQIRDLILSTYEKAVVLQKNLGHASAEQILQYRNELLEDLAKSKKMFDTIRNMRKVYSAPTSKQDALEKRSSKKWKIADASFKLFDKFGYMAILKQFGADYDILSSSSEVDDSVTHDVLAAVKKYISNADKLADSEKQELDEGIGSMISTALLATILAVPSALAASKPTVDIEGLIQKEKTYAGVTAALSKDDKVKYGSFAELQTVNIIARTLFAEASGEGVEGRKYVATTIFNRAGGDVDKLADVCLANKQYSCWNAIEGKTASKFKFDIPRALKSKKPSSEVVNIWNECKQTAADMMTGKFKPVNTIINSYYNPDKVTPSWDKDLVSRKKINHHLFGYLPEHDGYAKKQLSRSTYKSLHKKLNPGVVAKVAAPKIKAAKVVKR